MTMILEEFDLMRVVNGTSSETGTHNLDGYVKCDWHCVTQTRMR
jgi:hypothetical protein